MAIPGCARSRSTVRAAREDEEPGEAEKSGRDYFTIDRWTSLDAYAAFNDRFAHEYEELDNRFLELCEVEVCLGKFDVVK